MAVAAQSPAVHGDQGIALKSCLDCGQLSDQSRCPDHRKAREKIRGTATQRGYDSKYQRLARAKKAEHIAMRGYICSGYGVPPHASQVLTADHLRWPAETLDDLQILCPGCQNRKGAAR